MTYILIGISQAFLFCIHITTSQHNDKFCYKDYFLLHKYWYFFITYYYFDF